MSSIISICNPTIKRRDMDSVLTCLVNDRIGPGELNRELVEKLKAVTNSSSGYCFREPSRAVSVALDCLNIERGRCVVLSPLAPAYILNVILEKGLEPLYADVDEVTACLTSAAVMKFADKNPGAVIIDYPAGNFPDTAAIAACGFPVIEDISTVVGVQVEGVPAGTIGDFAVIAMEDYSLVTCGGGAALLTSSKKQNSVLKQASEILDRTVFLPDMNSALGIVQVNNIGLSTETKEEIYRIFLNAILKSRHKALPLSDGIESSACSFTVLINTGMNDVKLYCKKKGVETVHTFEKCALAAKELPDFPVPNALSFLMRSLSFPYYPTLGGKNIETISRVLSTLP